MLTLHLELLDDQSKCSPLNTLVLLTLQTLGLINTIDSNANPIATLVGDVVTSQCSHADLTCDS